MLKDLLIGLDARNELVECKHRSTESLIDSFEGYDWK